MEDERLRLLLKQQYSLEDETDSLDGLKSSLSRHSATAAEGVAEFGGGGGGGGGGDAKASETQKVAAKERERKESELKKLAGGGAAMEGGDLVPGKWAETVISVDRVTKVGFVEYEGWACAQQFKCCGTAHEVRLNSLSLSL